MKTALRLVFVVGLVGALAACSQVAPKAPAAVTTQSATGTIRSLVPAGTGQLTSTAMGTDYGIQNPEFPAAMAEQDAAAGSPNGRVVNREPLKTAGSFAAPSGTAAGVVSGPAGLTTFEGLNHFDQRYADSGNQFSTEPPDQGLCVGNGYVVEAVNDVAQVYTTDGTPATGVASLNQFFGYAPAIQRPRPYVFGPFVTDPSCHYDATSGRWFMTVLTLAVDSTTGDFTGQNFIDIAVSTTSDPTSTWSIYHMDVTGDGASAVNLGDYPHFAVDAHGVYITTDSFPFFDAGYNGAWLYALSKSELLDHGTVSYYSTPMVDSGGIPGYSVAPAMPVGPITPTTNGTEYFTSTTTVYQASGNALNVWALDGTASLDTGSPSLKLTSVRVPVAPYGDPPPAAPQKNGNTPLATLLNAGLFGKPPHHQQEGPIATNDSGMKQTVFVNGHLWAALSTITQGAPAGGHSQGANQTGVAWYDLTPDMSGDTLSASLAHSGFIAPTNADLVFPAIAMNTDGHGAIAVTLTGNHYYPSAAYVPIDVSTNGKNVSTGDIVVANAGAGPQDGFTEYFVGGNRPRWGDYGAGSVDEAGNLWIASEDIHQTCSVAEFASDYTCGGTRSALANWSTQITKVDNPTP